MHSPLELVTLDRAARELALADSLDEIKTIRDKAEAVRCYAKSAAWGLQAQNRAAALKLRAERKAGRLLSDLCLRGGDRKSNGHRARLTLTELGISQHQSTRWQLEAKLSDDDFEEYVRSKQEAGGEIAAADVLRMARKQTEKPCGRPGSSNGDALAPNDCLPTISPQPSTNGETVSCRSTGPPDLLEELKEHHNLLDQILRPIYTDQSCELHTAECRVLGTLMAEVRALLERLT